MLGKKKKKRKLTAPFLNDSLTDYKRKIKHLILFGQSLNSKKLTLWSGYLTVFAKPASRGLSPPGKFWNTEPWIFSVSKLGISYLCLPETRGASGEPLG